VGKSHFDLHFASATEIQNNVKHVVQKIEKLSGEVMYCFPSEEVRYYEYVFTAVIDNEKQVEFVAATERDITGRKLATEALRKSEEKLLALNDELERKVEKCTRELLETRARYLNY
jgi:hypothetical protein